MAKKALMLLVVAFAIFFLLSRPESAAESVQGAGGALGEGFDRVARFFTELVS